MKKDKVHRTSRVFTTYIFSYTGMVLLSCILVGFFLFTYFIQDFMRINRQNLQEKLTVAAEDLENQLDIMEEISYKVSTDTLYRPYYLAQGSVYEKEVAEDLMKFTSYSTMTSEYFLLYEHDIRVFRSVGSTTPLPALLQSVYGEKDAEALAAQISEVSSFTAICPAEGDPIFLCYPVKFVGNARTEYAVMTFVCTAASFQQRMTNAVGSLGSSCSITLCGIPTQQTRPNASADKLITVTSESGRFVLQLDISDQNYASGISLLQWFNLAGIILCVLLLLLIAMGLAYRNFKPIREISDRCGHTDSNGTQRDELQEIGQAFDSMMAENERTRTELHRQTEQMKQQLLWALLNGNCDGELLRRLKLLGIESEGRWCFCVLLDFPEHTVRNDFQPMIALIEDLSGGGTHFYAIPRRSGNGIAVLVTMEEESATEALELLRSLVETQNSDCRIGAGIMVLGLERISASGLEAAAALRADSSAGQQAGLGLGVDALPTDELLSAVQKGDVPNAEKWFAQLEKQLDALPDSQLLLRYAFSSIVSAVLRTARVMKLRLDSNQLGLMITASDRTQFCAQLRKILHSMCEQASRNAADDEQALLDRIMTYIHAHYQEYDFSMERITAEFGLSVSYLSRLIKKGVGVNYRDYVIHLKIEQAKKYLASGVSISVTNDLIGYSNISHFIKTFKQIVGVTPLTYQKNAAVGGVAEGEEPDYPSTGADAAFESDLHITK